MIIKARQKNTRQTPRKVRLVANEVKNLKLEEAIKQLAVMERRATLVILKALKQAISNAINNHGFSFEDLELDNILVTEGPRYKRFRAVSRGRAHTVLKRTCHVEVILKTVDKKAALKKEKEEKKAQPKKETKKTDKKPVAKKTSVAPQKADKKIASQQPAHQIRQRKTQGTK